MLFILDAPRDLKRRPDVAFVSYTRWPATVIAREAAWNALPDLAVEIVSPTNLAAEIDNKITDYFQAQGRQVWVVLRASAFGLPYPMAGSQTVGGVSFKRESSPRGEHDYRLAPAHARPCRSHV